MTPKLKSGLRRFRRWMSIRMRLPTPTRRKRQSCAVRSLESSMCDCRKPDRWWCTARPGTSTCWNKYRQTPGTRHRHSRIHARAANLIPADACSSSAGIGSGADHHGFVILKVAIRKPVHQRNIHPILTGRRQSLARSQLGNTIHCVAAAWLTEQRLFGHVKRSCEGGIRRIRKVDVKLPSM